MSEFIGFVFFTKILNSIIEVQILAPIRRFRDGITFFDFKINLDIFEGDHNPKFKIELTILNIYNHILIQNQNEMIESKEEITESLIDESKRYIQLGIDPEKIITTESTSVIIWSITRKKIVSGPDVYELIKLSDGSHTLSIENNRFVSLLCYSEIHEDLLNSMKEADKIIVTNPHKPGIYRFGIVPNE